MDPFLRLLKSVGWPPPWVFLRGLVPVTVWHALTLFAPSLSEAEKLAWAVLGCVTVQNWTRAPFAIRITRPDDRVSVAAVAFLLWFVVAALVMLAPTQVWLQRFFTVIYALLAVGCLVDAKVDRGISLQGFSKQVVARAGPQMVRGVFLFYLTLALLNETLIAQVSLQAWVIWLSALPIFIWVTSRALLRTIWLSVTRFD